MRNDWNAAKISGGATLKGGALNQGFKYWIWGRWIGLMVGKSRRRRTELEKKAMKKKRQRSWAKSFIWENIKILKDEKGEAEKR